jgi:hypothetical protein
MGDKGGKKDKEKNKQQQLTKQKQEKPKKQDKARRQRLRSRSSPTAGNRRHSQLSDELRSLVITNSAGR